MIRAIEELDSYSRDIQNNDDDLDIITEDEPNQNNMFTYRGFVCNWEDDSYQIYTNEEWNFGDEYRTAEFNASSANEAMKMIDAYYSNSDDNDIYDLEDNDESSDWIEVDSKSVEDSDGFMTDYTMYRHKEDGTFIFMFGDKDAYSPDPDYCDWSCDTEAEAREWFDNYHGFSDDEDEDDIIDVDYDDFMEATNPGSIANTPGKHKSDDNLDIITEDSDDQLSPDVSKKVFDILNDIEFICKSTYDYEDEDWTVSGTTEMISILSDRIDSLEQLLK